MTYQIVGINGFPDHPTAVSEVTGHGPEGQFHMTYSRDGKPQSLVALGVNGEPQAGAYAYHTGMLELEPPMEVERIDDGTLLAQAYADYQANPPQHPDFPL